MADQKSIPSPFAEGTIKTSYVRSPTDAAAFTPYGSGEIGAVSVERFCAWSSIGRTRAYEEIKSGRLRTKKVGRRTLITFEAALEWMGLI